MKDDSELVAADRQIEVETSDRLDTPAGPES
jgi:hypothetical protein